MSAECALRAPTDYQAWLKCFDTLQNSSVDAAYIDTLREGRLSGDAAMLARFQPRLVSTVNAMLSRQATSFLRQYRMTADSGDAYALELLYRRFLRNAKQCLFFRSLAFLPEDFSQELHKGVVGEVSRLTWQLLRNLEQNNAVELHDTIAAIHRGYTLF